MISLVFGLLIIIFALFQVSLLPFPFGLAAIIFWYLFRAEKNILVFVGLFSLTLAIISNLPLWLILLATLLSLYLFTAAKVFLPARVDVHLFLVAASLIVWEVLVFGLEKVVSL
ncbi:MAG: hypothetical protein Q8O75_02560 [bacterium]|nr:hypothetical protein [bacterium]